MPTRDVLPAVYTESTAGGTKPTRMLVPSRLPITVRIMADRLAFKDEVLRRRLEVLGYTNISPESMNEIRGDLELLVQQESSPSERAMNVSAVCSEYSTPSQLPHAPWPSYAECPVATERSADPYLSRTVQASAQPPSAQPQSGQTIASTRLVSWDCLRELTNAQPSRASCSGDSCSTSSSGHNGMNLRRKVLRHKNGETLVCDESPQSDMDSVSNDEFLPPPVASGEDSGSVIESEVCSTNDFYTQVLPRSAPVVHRSAGCEDGYYAVNYPSLIRPMEHPHTRNLKKMDPVARYFQYKEEWENFQPPGENPRKHLRWQIREQMWYKDEVFQKPQHAMTVNHYVVPTEKKRLALRWEVRHDLAQGIMPRSFYSPL